jgi:hypothetical protein
MLWYAPTSPELNHERQTGTWTRAGASRWLPLFTRSSAGMYTEANNLECRQVAQHFLSLSLHAIFSLDPQIRRIQYEFRVFIGIDIAFPKETGSLAGLSALSKVERDIYTTV